MLSSLYVLDTGILLTLIRKDALADHLDTHYQLRTSKTHSLVCIVSHGELGTIATLNNWGKDKLACKELLGI